MPAVVQPSTTPTTSTTSTRIPASLKPIILLGPSGAGKSTLLSLLFSRHPGIFGFSVSHTTRTPRAGELPGREYHFVTASEFGRLVATRAFLEHATFSAHRYGTTLQAVRDVEAQGKVCVLDIEVQGVRQVVARGDQWRVCFVAPPGMKELEERLRGRGTETEDGVQRRLSRAGVEMEWLAGEGRGIVQKVVVNRVLEEAYGELEGWVFGDGNGEGEGEVEREGEGSV
ncbi:MAG: hypothetical protein M1816_005857 [Peltula sp. TS41687]|nr:MAG: hypothetical protein M1816_005857 [Peltula sp. TS41687]